MSSFASGYLASEYYPEITQGKVATKLNSSIETTITPPTIYPECGYPFEFPAPPSPDEVTKRLNENAWSHPNTGIPSVARYDGAQLSAQGANCEDRFVYGTMASPRGDMDTKWGAWGVFDGHVGARTSEALSRHLIPYVHKYLRDVYSQKQQEEDSAIVAAIKAAFLDLDDIFVKTVPRTADVDDIPFAEKVARIAPGSNGSCALLSLYDPSTRTLRVACTGDSRAVLGRLRALSSLSPPSLKDRSSFYSGDSESTSALLRWKTTPLSTDQNGSSESEQARIAALHPGETGICERGRILGLACSRAFGDGHWKWPSEFLPRAKDAFNADYFKTRDPSIHKTPPYVTAEPEVTTMRLEKGRPAFLIMASDGLWDRMSSEQAVELVGRWIMAKGQQNNAPLADISASATSSKTNQALAPPSYQHHVARFDLQHATYNGGRLAGDFVDGKASTVQDANVAVHLMRNALGGTHQDLISALLDFRPPFARWVRDDITVQVVIFEG